MDGRPRSLGALVSGSDAGAGGRGGAGGGRPRVPASGQPKPGGHCPSYRQRQRGGDPVWRAPPAHPLEDPAGPRRPRPAPIPGSLTHPSPGLHAAGGNSGRCNLRPQCPHSGAAASRGQPPKGFPGAMEAMTLWVRQEVVLPNVGAHGEGYAPYLLTVFFFILTMNLLGLLPWGATATSNIAVTAALAIVSFLVIEVTGMRALGFTGYMKTIFYLPPGLPGGIGGSLLKVLLLIVMTPIEIIGKLAKPFALAVRLFANMTSGHVLVLALLGLTFLFQSYYVGIGASLLATGVMLLEVFVAFLQAFVFTLLTAVFIGLMRAEH